MSKSFLTRLGIVFKEITGIKDISVMRKNIHKYIGMFFYHKKFTADDLIEEMKKMGMATGSSICIHAAMKEFYNYRGTAEELICKIMQTIGKEGTLLMPAFPDAKDFLDENYIFDPLNAPTKAGFLAETFRRMPNVHRSINTQHSVCAWGKHAKWLTDDHHKGINCWDEFSPWFRMTEINTIVFTLGLPNHYIGTVDHCVEGLLYKEHPYWAQFLSKKRTFKYYDQNRNICNYTNLTGDIECRTRENRLIRHFSTKIYRKKKLSNLLIKSYDSKPCLKKMIALGRKGITMYYIPSPKKYYFDK